MNPSLSLGRAWAGGSAEGYPLAARGINAALSNTAEARKPPPLSQLFTTPRLRRRYNGRGFLWRWSHRFEYAGAKGAAQQHTRSPVARARVFRLDPTPVIWTTETTLLR
jgi:hypothetical protein